MVQLKKEFFFESINFAEVKKLPVVFICENNLYSVYSPLSVRQPKKRSIAKMVKSMGLNVISCDGNDIIKIYNAIKKATNETRNGNGPYFLEFFTYRWREHCGPNFDNHIGYRTPAEFEKWKKKDPIKKLLKKIQSKNLKKIKNIQTKTRKEILSAFKFAEESPFPKQSSAYKGVYAPK